LLLSAAEAFHAVCMCWSDVTLHVKMRHRFFSFSMLFLFLPDCGPSAPFRARLPLILARPRVMRVACVPDCGRLRRRVQACEIM